MIHELQYSRWWLIRIQIWRFIHFQISRDDFPRCDRCGPTEQPAPWWARRRFRLRLRCQRRRWFPWWVSMDSTSGGDGNALRHVAHHWLYNTIPCHFAEAARCDVQLQVYYLESKNRKKLENGLLHLVGATKCNIRLFEALYIHYSQGWLYITTKGNYTSAQYG